MLVRMYEHTRGVESLGMANQSMPVDYQRHFNSGITHCVAMRSGVGAGYSSSKGLYCLLALVHCIASQQVLWEEFNLTFNWEILRLFSICRDFANVQQSAGDLLAITTITINTYLAFCIEDQLGVWCCFVFAPMLILHALRKCLIRSFSFTL